MEINVKRLSTDNEDKSRCYVHARGMIKEDGFGIITMQKLELSGNDVFYGIECIKTEDGGKTFSKPALCRGLGRRYFEDGTSLVFCDATPFYHKASGKILLTGHAAWYGDDNALLRTERPRSPIYSVYSEQKADFDGFEMIEMPKTPDDKFYSSGAGCSQITELSNGDLLIPVYYKSRAEAANPKACTYAAVMRCGFDGERITVKEIGRGMTSPQPRGFGEPSVIEFDGEYFLALRNDVTGYVTKGTDGINYAEPRELCFDNGENLGNYNTQQHWITLGGKLWLVYTRRAGNNDHVFRHRAPLFIAEFDPQKMCVIRSTERIAVPERGARLGNFGCQSRDDKAFVFASEWMQCGTLGWDACAAHGSDNSIFISEITP